MNTKLLKLAFVYQILFNCDVATALPQYVQYGYFGCQSCHASPTGGGVLTPYGRSIAAEKISTWARKDEEQPLHGTAGTPPEWLLLGGHFRQIQTYVENDQVKEGRYFTMQRDAEAGVHVGKFWAVSSLGKETSAIPRANGHYKLLSRRHFVRYDFTEEFMIRFGKFYPRFGLMVPNHGSGIRRGMGFDQGMETNNIEVLYGGEFLEASVTGVVKPYTTHQIEEAVETQRGIYGSAALFFRDRNRLSLGYGKVMDRLSTVTKESVAATLSPGGLNVMLEVARRRVLASEAPQPRVSMFSFLRIAGDVYRGVTPYLLHEVRMPDIHDGTTRTDVIAPGLQLHPRPHFDFDLSAGYAVKPATFKFTKIGVLTFHYYL